MFSRSITAQSQRQRRARDADGAAAVQRLHRMIEAEGEVEGREREEAIPRAFARPAAASLADRGVVAVGAEHRLRRRGRARRQADHHRRIAALGTHARISHRRPALQPLGLRHQQRHTFEPRGRSLAKDCSETEPAGNRAANGRGFERIQQQEDGADPRQGIRGDQPQRGNLARGKPMRSPGLMPLPTSQEAARQTAASRTR
jgi:hypothetical protein